MSAFSRVKSFYSSAGRANRKEYWTWVAAMVVVFAIAVGVATLFGDNGVYDLPGVPRPARLTLVAIPFLLMFVLVVKMRSVSIRRRHDTDVGVRYRHIRWIPFVGRYADFAMLGFLPSTWGSNEHGEGPGTSGVIDVFDAPSAPRRPDRAPAPSPGDSAAPR